MIAVTKYSLCALISIGLACSTQAKQDDQKEQKDKVENKCPEKKDKKEDKEKKDKVAVVDEVNGATATCKAFSVPDAGSTVALLSLSLAAVGVAHRRWKSSPAEP